MDLRMRGHFKLMLTNPEGHASFFSINMSEEESTNSVAMVVSKATDAPYILENSTLFVIEIREEDNARPIVLHPHQQVQWARNHVGGDPLVHLTVKHGIYS